MIEIRSPNREEDNTKKGLSIFLGGTIEMGKIDNWQEKLVEQLSDYDGIIYNPRQLKWPMDIYKSSNNPIFKDQVLWELEHQEKADLIILYFYSNTYSPITLLELGLHAAGGKVVVCCNESFWRYGNVKIVCDEYEIPMMSTEVELVEYIKGYIIDRNTANKEAEIIERSIEWYVTRVQYVTPTKQLLNWLITELSYHENTTKEFDWLLGFIRRFPSSVNYLPILDSLININNKGHLQIVNYIQANY